MNNHALKCLTDEVYLFIEKFKISEFEIEIKSTDIRKVISVKFVKDYVLAFEYLSANDIGKVEKKLMDRHKSNFLILKSNHKL